jgi:hypothetical protein
MVLRMQRVGLMATTPEQKIKRLELCNQAIVLIASYGRKFFSLHAENRNTEQPERISRFELRPNGQLWFIDKWTQKPIYVAYRRGRWRGFSEGGTLRSLVCEMADWITGKRPEFPVGFFGPWRQEVCGGDLWGYGDDMPILREKVKELTHTTLEREP